MLNYMMGTLCVESAKRDAESSSAGLFLWTESEEELEKHQQSLRSQEIFYN